MSGVEMQSYAPVGRDSRSPSLDNLAGIQTSTNDSDVPDIESTIDNLPIIDDERLVVASYATPTAAVIIEPFNGGNRRMRRVDSDAARGVVADHQRNPCRCCCGLVLTLPNLIFTIVVIYFTVYPWGSVHSSDSAHLISYVDVGVVVSLIDRLYHQVNR
jgi:hypothetical protein